MCICHAGNMLSTVVEHVMSDFKPVSLSYGMCLGKSAHDLLLKPDSQ
jgi:hypothetical protein